MTENTLSVMRAERKGYIEAAREYVNNLKTRGKVGLAALAVVSGLGVDYILSRELPSSRADASVVERTVKENKEVPVKYGWRLNGGFLLPGWVKAPEKEGSMYGTFDTNGDMYPDKARAPTKPRTMSRPEWREYTLRGDIFPWNDAAERGAFSIDF